MRDYGTVPDLSYAKVLGCLAFVHKPAGSLESRATQGTVIGYAKQSISITSGTPQLIVCG